MKDDPTKPYKAYVATVVAVITALIASNVFDNKIIVAVLTAVLAGAGAFITPNPKLSEGPKVVPQEPN